jgi:hypothetical protein
MSANTLAKPPVALTDDKTAVIPAMLRFHAQHDQRFGYAAALLKFGRHFDHVKQRPRELSRGRMGQCYANCARALSPTLGWGDPPYFYAEGYALDPVLGIPFEHAWLVDVSGRAIDLTWKDTKKAVYYGVTFKDGFVYEAMRETRIFGILGNFGLRERLFANADAFAAVLSVPGVPDLSRGSII